MELEDTLVELNDEQKHIDVIAAGEKKTIVYEYTVTEEDILRGTILNVMTASGKDPNGHTVTDEDDETVDPEDILIDLDVEKTSDVKSLAKVGEDITYTIVVANNSNVTCYNVKVDDDLVDLHEVIEVLAQGEIRTFEAAYTVTDEDRDNGEVKNTVHVKADPIPDPNDPGSELIPEDTDEVIDNVERQQYTLTIRYLYENGETAYQERVYQLYEGDIYNVESPVIKGYSASMKIVSGTMPGHDVQVTVIYRKNGPDVVIIDDFDPALGLGSGMMNLGDCFD